MIDFRRVLLGQRSQKSPKKTAQSHHLDVREDLKPSHLMAGVLSPQSDTQTFAKDRRREPNPSSSLLRIGNTLNERTALLLQAVRRLTPILDRETSDTIRQSATECAGLACKIAVVGQMNAGKSSLINALVEEGDLLPSDVNPWTTVLTKLHFGVEGSPRSGASFQMFTIDEWRRLAVGGRTREIVDGLIKDFDWDRLQIQVEEMMARARRKLGERLDGLLGSVHAYPTLTPGLLERYVAGGYDNASDGGSDAGEFADVTKVANVYLDLGAFTYPAIVTDTPGVNDPFLVRDEITRQSLEQTDICVVVLTARDPLSEADLALLRTLHRLERLRVIIFVNKLDEIEPVPALEKMLKARMEPVLDRAFPGVEIPVIFGSVTWGKQALAAQAHIAASNAVPVDLAYGHPLNAAATPGALLRRSGLPDLALAISAFTKDGPIAVRLAEEVDYIETLACNALAACQFEITTLTELARDRDAAQNSIQDFESGLQLTDILPDLEARFFRVISGQLSIMDRDLRSVVAQIVGDSPFGSSEVWLAWWEQIELQTRLALERRSVSCVKAAFHALGAAETAFIQSLEPSHQARFPKSESTVATQAPIFELRHPVTPVVSDERGATEPSNMRAAAAFEPAIETMLQHYSSELSTHSSRRIDRLKLASLRPFEIAISNLREFSALAGGADFQTAIADREAKAKELRAILQVMAQLKE